MTKILPAKLTISRFSGYKDGVSITIRDDKSHCVIVELELSVKDFGKAVLGLSEQPCEATWRVKNLGRKYEHKTEIVPWDFLGSQTKEKALELFEVDGWSGRAEDLGNHHKSKGDNKYEVVFVRWVKE